MVTASKAEATPCASRTRKDNAPEIAGAFRRLALNILQRDTSIKENIRGKRLRAGWDERVLNAIYAGSSAGCTCEFPGH